MNVGHHVQMCMKEYNFCRRTSKGDKSSLRVLHDKCLKQTPPQLLTKFLMEMVEHTGFIFNFIFEMGGYSLCELAHSISSLYRPHLQLLDYFY